MVKIELSKGKYAKIDPEDIDTNKWYAVKCGKLYYAARTINLSKGKTKKIYLHKQIMGHDGIVDFVNGDSLDCRKCNLRITNKSGDAKNKKAHGKSRYLGVHFHTSKTKYKNKKGDEKIYESSGWVAKIKIGDKYKHLGIFKNEIDAAKKYDEFAKKHHKEFARLNF